MDRTPTTPYAFVTKKYPFSEHEEIMCSPSSLAHFASYNMRISSFFYLICFCKKRCFLLLLSPLML